MTISQPSIDELKTARSLRESIADFMEMPVGMTVGLGQPPADEDDWFPFARLAEADFGGQVVRRIAEQTGASAPAAGTYTLRYALYYPLLLAGYLFAAEQRVLALEGSLITANREWLNHLYLMEPEVIVLPGDPLHGQPGSTTVDCEGQLVDALFRETSRLINPLIDSWNASKLAARPNAWGCAIDSLAYGFQLAGKHRIGPDAAWTKWEQVVAGRVFPVRRRPRRFLFTCDGEPDELLVRSGCCLWFTQPQAKNGPIHYCASCYIETDARRLEQMIAYKRRQKTDA